MKKIVALIIAIAVVASMGVMSVSAAEDPVWQYYPNDIYIDKPDLTTTPPQDESWSATGATGEKSDDDNYVRFTAQKVTEAYFYTGWASGDLTSSQVSTIYADAGNTFVIKCRIPDASYVGPEGPLVGELLAGDNGLITAHYTYTQTTDWQYVVVDMTSAPLGAMWSGEINWFRVDFVNANAITVDNINAIEGFQFDLEYIKLFSNIDAANAYVAEAEAGGDETGSDNTGSDNTGSDNTGSDNTGSDNTGSDNTGSDNTGSDNTGAGNTGSENTGSDSTGSENTGSENTGSDNTGSDNTGSDNAETDDATVAAFVMLIAMACAAAVVLKKRAF
ncbi:MAG: pentapeptide repeat-containing protein [Clostridia bacterium]|nr:pentapeptide repeat-containing protein [Clostridia bacterium]